MIAPLEERWFLARGCQNGGVTDLKRGRPSTVDPNRVERVALDLILERGFDHVTMADIADAAGIARRTLFRTVSSKVELVWGGAEEVHERITERLAAHDRPELSTGSVIARAYLETYENIPRTLRDLMRERLLIIHRNPAVYAYGHARWLEDHGEIAGFIAAREGREATELGVVLRAQLVSALTFSALLWWAERPEADLAATMTEALGELQRRIDAD